MASRKDVRVFNGLDRWRGEARKTKATTRTRRGGGAEEKGDEEEERRRKGTRRKIVRMKMNRNEMREGWRDIIHTS